MPKVRVVHGRWGEISMNGVILAEATGIEYTIEIERVDVPQLGARWNTFTEGIITGTGTLRMHKVYSRFEDRLLDYVKLTPAEMRAARTTAGAASYNPRPYFQLTVSLSDPHSYGLESETLNDCLFWSYTGGFNVTDLVDREWPFSFESITPGTRIDGGSLPAGPPPPAP